MRRSIEIFMLIMLVAAVPVLAHEEETEEPPPEPLWKGSLGLAYLGTSGNSETTTFGLDFDAERRATPWGYTFTGRLNRNEDNGVLTAERYMLSGRAVRALSERWELFGSLAGEKDPFAGYDLQVLVGVGATYRMLTGPRHHLSFDGGLSYTDENRIDPNPDVSFLGAILGLNYEWKITDGSSLTQVLVFLPNFDDTEDWRLRSETGLTAAVNSWLALRLAYEIRYRNEPVGDAESTDTTSSASVVFRF
jgi:putative salt-induced outer membrane protein